MNSNDRTYFRKITPEFIKRGFDGYQVPENIRQRVAFILRRFTIFGICDAMYIANTIAHINGTGDGQGNFRQGEITEVEKIVKFLMQAYSCNIYPCDERDLTDILCNGNLSKQRMISGLKNSAKIRKEKIASIKDVWRTDFLKGELNIIQDTIKDIAA